MDIPRNDIAVSFHDLTLSYGKKLALKGVSLDIKSRQLVGLIGPDGVGKSTLLSLITGAHAMQGGELMVLGGDMRSKAHRNKVCPMIAYMPQGLGKNLYFTLTVEENLQYFARLFGQDAAERRARIDRLTKSTGLYRFLDRPAGKLSGGMKQKLGLCCSLIHDPDLLVLDEPTTGVDPLARRQFWDLVDSIQKERPNLTVIVATAYMDEAQRFDWLIAMDDGKILGTGTSKEILDRTGCADLDSAFIQLLPEEKRSGHKTLVVPPLEKGDGSTAIEAIGLTKRFGDFTAVDHVSFKIPKGEIFGFLGSNGCGKSTTMKMLTGLLPVTDGEVYLFGKKIAGGDIETRKKLGYMTQMFSLYNELTVRQNLELYARLYAIPEDDVANAVDAMIDRFGLREHEFALPSDLPLGIKQRLSLAAAVIHRPQILILDEPTSGVDPVARDVFWEMIIELSRNDKVTIFITTHFMNEAERCDRISLMHAGKSLACDSPARLVEERKADTLEEAFISYLMEADATATEAKEAAAVQETAVKEEKPRNAFVKWLAKYFDLRRWYSCCWRETLELSRDRICTTLAMFGAVILLFVIAFGISMDVDDIKFAVLDHDQTIASVNYVHNIRGSRYFLEQPDIVDHDDMDERMRRGDVAMVVEIPPDFSKNLERGAKTEVMFWVDGADTSRAETINNYAEAMHAKWMANYANTHPEFGSAGQFDIQTRYRYNPDVLSLPAMAPGAIALLLMMIPAVLSALSVVREKEQGSITNLYVTPLTRSEFMLGKQTPYVVVSLISATLLVLITAFLFNVPVKGNVLTLALGLLIYCILSTGFGMLASSVTRSQIAVIFLTMIATLVPATQMCGLISPVESQQGLARLIGSIHPTTYMLLVSKGSFNKALGFFDLWPMLLTMLIEVPFLLGASILLQKKQES
ncbi:MAG: ribosome-associated ATPase/putative transporter RbbA [Victivallaceae bacterium]|nr:ribosome-associated ATPase/putative transporter RbbA [Victivallaceae bacterium]